jgi:hypothetical protein
MLGWLIPNGEGKIDLQSTLQRLNAAGEVIENLEDREQGAIKAIFFLL